MEASRKDVEVATRTIPYDSAEHFRDPEAQRELLRDAIESRDAGYLAHAIGVIARAHGMSDLERKTGINRTALYRALDVDGNPTLTTLLKVFDALDLDLAIGPKPRDHDSQALASAG